MYSARQTSRSWDQPNRFWTVLVASPKQVAQSWFVHLRATKTSNMPPSTSSRLTREAKRSTPRELAAQLRMFELVDLGLEDHEINHLGHDVSRRRQIVVIWARHESEKGCVGIPKNKCGHAKDI